MIKKALKELKKERTPLLHNHVKSLTGQLQGDYRLRVGDWRLLLMPEKNKKLIHIYTILPRGDVY